MSSGYSVIKTSTYLMKVDSDMNWLLVQTILLQLSFYTYQHAKHCKDRNDQIKYPQILLRQKSDGSDTLLI